MKHHPRLYATATQLNQLHLPPATPLLRAAAKVVARDAAQFVKSPEFDWVLNTHNAHLVRARRMQGRVVTLLVRYFQTGRREFRDAVVAHIREMGGWDYWSWITWRQNKPDPTAIYDLSYGENSMTLAIAYDWLHDELTSDEKKMIGDIAQRRSFDAFLHHTANPAPNKHAWWLGHRQSNWNAVCAGGAGMLALAMYEDLPCTRKVLARVERSFVPYMRELKNTDGAWPEGIGYWNYGMRYAFMYLLSHENATGRSHALLRQDATRKTLFFPLDFCPSGIPCSFGDANQWSPMPFHLAMADRLGETGLAGDLLQRADRQSFSPPTAWPDAADFLLLGGTTRRKTPLSSAPPATRPRPVARCYKGLDWTILADRMPDPRLYLSIRGGTTEVPHGHRDLLSFHCVVDGSPMIVNLGPSEYLDSTFSNRRYELFEMSPPSKNTLLIDGVGIAGNSTATTTMVTRPGLRGVRLDATTCMGDSPDAMRATACARLFLLLDGRAALIVDRMILSHAGRVEARFFTPANVAFTKTGATLRNGKTVLRAAFAANVPATLHRAASIPTTPQKPATMLRWCGDRQHQDFILATLLSPGSTAPRIEIKKGAGGLRIDVGVGAWRRTIRLGDDLT
jgi:hypothetical protein